MSLSRCEFIPKSDAALIERSAGRRNIRFVWHLSWLEQIPDILRIGALLSRAQLDALGVRYSPSSWGYPGKEVEMQDYVSCSVIPPWGMSTREPEKKALLLLQPRVLWRRGTLFCGKWSSFNDVQLEQLRNQGADVTAFDLMFPNDTSGFPAPAPGEFLVSDCIPISDSLKVIVVYEEATKDALVASCAKIISPEGVPVVSTFRILAQPGRFRGG